MSAGFTHAKETAQLREATLMGQMGISDEPTKFDKRGRVSFKYSTISETPMLDYHKHPEKKMPCPSSHLFVSTGEIHSKTKPWLGRWRISDLNSWGQ